jgi:hypothetical protein
VGHYWATLTAETAWMRTREVWMPRHRLGQRRKFYDIRPKIFDALLQDVLKVWARCQEKINFTLAPTGRGMPFQ